MAGQFSQQVVRSLALAAALAAGPVCPAQEENPAVYSVSDMQAGGYVFDKGSRLITDPQLKISIVPMFETFRTQAPLNVMVRLQWNGPGLLEGRVLCDMYAFERYVGSWKSHEVAVNQEILSFPLTLPPSPLYNDRDLFNLRIAFETADRTIVMDQRDLPIKSGWSRNFVVGVVAPENVTRISGFKSNVRTPVAGDLFQIANFNDRPEHAAQIVSNTTPVPTRDFPLDPIRLTAFDLIVLSPEALREFRPPQWQALAVWIRAGGRACLIATLPVPQNLRAGWRELFNENPDEPKLTFTEAGNAEFTTGEPTLRLRAGCGRVLALTEPADVDSRKWKEDLLWLFAVRDSASSSILTMGSWTIGPPGENPVTFHPLVPLMRPIAEMRRPLNSPEIGRVSPVTILFLLGACLLLIGPVDYFVLGRLGLRRLTWVFLPCVAIATTWATMRVSQSALGGRDYDRAVSVADLDSAGRVARVSRFEQRYAGRESVGRQSLTSSLRLDFERPLFGWNASSNALIQWDGVRGGDDASKQPPLRYAGRVTGGYDVLEPMYQWSPRLFRETTFGDDPRIDSRPLENINWAELSNTTWATDAGRSKIRDLVRDVLPEAEVYVRFGLITADCSQPLKTAPESLNPVPAYRPQLRRLPVPLDAPEPESPEAFLHLVANATSCVRTYIEGGTPNQRPTERPWGLFGLVRERSPTCGADLEDLQWIDSEDPTEAVLLILVKGDDSVIFRRRLALMAEKR